MSRWARFRARKIATDVLGIGRTVDHRGDHEGGVDHLAEAELLDEVVGPAEQRRRPALALDQELEAAEQHAVLEGEIDLVGREVLLQRLDRRIVAARLEADRDRHAGKVGRRADGRIGGNEDARRRDRIGVGIEPGMAVRGRDVDRPVAGAAHVGLAALLDALEGALARPCCGAGRRSSGSARGTRSRAPRRGNSPSPRPPTPAGGSAARR